MLLQGWKWTYFNLKLKWTQISWAGEIKKEFLLCSMSKKRRILPLNEPCNAWKEISARQKRKKPQTLVSSNSLTSMKWWYRSKFFPDLWQCKSEAVIQVWMLHKPDTKMLSYYQKELWYSFSFWDKNWWSFFGLLVGNLFFQREIPLPPCSWVMFWRNQGLPWRFLCHKMQYTVPRAALYPPTHCLWVLMVTALQRKAMARTEYGHKMDSITVWNIIILAFLCTSFITTMKPW